MGYIENIFPDGISSQYKQYFVDATNFWNEIIIKGHAPITLEEHIDVSDRCLYNHIFQKGTVINGIAILSGVVPIDGPNNILGQAGVCIFDRDPKDVDQKDPLIYPMIGLMKFDEADVAGLIKSGNFLEVVIHEMAHVIGYGVLWNIYKLVDKNCFIGDCNPVYTGIHAKNAYAELSGEFEDIPVANTGSMGTKFVHWREKDFQTELMTGYLNADVSNPVSKMTIASFKDLKYEVNMEKAQEYNLPNELARPVLSRRIEMLGDILELDMVGIEEVYAEQRARREINGGGESIIERFELEKESEFGGVIAVMLFGFLGLAGMMVYMARLQTRAIKALSGNQAGANVGTKNPML